MVSENNVMPDFGNTLDDWLGNLVELNGSSDGSKGSSNSDLVLDSLFDELSDGIVLFLEETSV